ncbi:MAG TPA: HD domain-containing phosphohydrolase [Terriglobales bacterium]|nr:HD domain-containing phosphohydrolase [Terriglobales bacterium]
MRERILLVDDDSNVLDGYRRSLSREFLLETAIGSEQALALIQKNGPYAVIVSDMRMPGMNGIQLLSAAKTASPDTIRIILTGNADLQTAIDAINEGSIFRFLIKPCNREVMAKILTAALMQHRLVMAEKELLEQTLSGSIQVLTEVLSLVNPAAFGRAERARRYIRHVVKSMKLENPWQYEIAAMLSQLGCVTLAPETIEAIYKGEALTPNEQAQYAGHPSVAYDLLSKIPRLEPIAWMIEHQNGRIPPEGGPENADIRRGAEILRLILAYEDLIHKGFSRNETVHRLARLNPKFSPEFFNALVTLDPHAEEEETSNCRIEELAPGMIIQHEIRAVDGTLIISKGQEVTSTVIFKLKNLQARRAISGNITVSVPSMKLSSATGPA